MATRLSSSDTKNYTQIPNGNKTEDRDIALDEIDATAPITIGNTHSFKEVFSGLNKIIKAIISRFSDVGDEIAELNNTDNRYYYFDGKTFGEEKTKVTLTSYNATATTEFELPQKYTHGFIYDHNGYTSWRFIGSKFNNTVTISYPNNSGSKRFNVQVTLNNDNSKSKLIFTVRPYSSSMSYPYIADISEYTVGEFYR